MTISADTRRLMFSVLVGDPAYTPELGERVARALGDGADVVPICEVARRIGRTPPTVRALVKSGRLVAVPGAGGRNAGITAESLEAYCRGGAA